MTETGSGQGRPGDEAGEKIPFMQRVLDNHFLLLFLGVVIPTVFYLMWGIMEVANIPIAK
jgi:hypothetical protein